MKKHFQFSKLTFFPCTFSKRRLQNNWNPACTHECFELICKKNTARKIYETIIKIFNIHIHTHSDLYMPRERNAFGFGKKSWKKNTPRHDKGENKTRKKFPPDRKTEACFISKFQIFFFKLVLFFGFVYQRFK